MVTIKSIGRGLELEGPDSAAAGQFLHQRLDILGECGA